MSYESFFHRLPVLVTGATGFIGTHLVERLAELGARVRCLVRKTSRLDALPHGVELARGELAKGEGLDEALRGVDLVFHLAGVTKASSVEHYYRGNAQATLNLLAALASTEARLVHVSSLAAVGPTPDGLPLNEDARPQPISHYGRSKLAAEQAVRDSAVAARAVIVRPPVVFGPRDTDVLELFRMAARGWMLVVGDPDARFSVICVEDLVQGLLAAAASERAAGRTYFVAAREPLSWRELAELSGRLLSRKVRLFCVPRQVAWPAALGFELAARLRRRPAIISRDKLREATAGHWLCDVSRAAADLGFHPPTPLEEAFKRTLHWYRRAGWL